MATEVTSVEPVQTAAVTAPTKKVIPPASAEALKEPAPANGNAAANGPANDNTSTETTTEKVDGAQGEQGQQAQAEEPKVASRLAKIAQADKRIAQERKKLQEEREAWEREKGSQSEGATNWQKFQAAKEKEGKLAALRQLFSEDEINQEIYTQLTDEIFPGASGQLTQKDVEKAVQKKLEEARKAEEESRKTAQEQHQAAYQEKANAYLNDVGQVFKENVTKYPAIAELGLDGEAVLSHAAAVFARDKQVPSVEAVLEHFEGKLKEKIKRLTGSGVETKAPTSTAGLSNDATPKNTGKKLSEKEAWEELKRTWPKN